MTMTTADTDNPYSLGCDSAYQAWRARKLEGLKKPLSPISIQNPVALSTDEKSAIGAQIAQRNYALFQLNNPEQFDQSQFKLLGHQLGLVHLDENLYANESAISEVRVIAGGRRGEYIPYTNKALSWHTDGYYNPEERAVRAFMLYCQQDASQGGDNQLFDPELLYIRLRDTDPAYIEALMQPDALTIPATIEDGELIRPEVHCPVYSLDRTNHLHMRYSQRKTYIQWKPDAVLQSALTTIGQLLSGDTDPILSLHMNAGQGLICNNVLHTRSAFTDSVEHPRIMYRARYYERIEATSI